MKKKADAKRTHAWFISSWSIGPIMQMLVLLRQYLSVIKKLTLWILGAENKLKLLHYLAHIEIDDILKKMTQSRLIFFNLFCSTFFEHILSPSVGSILEEIKHRVF